MTNTIKCPYCHKEFEAGDAFIHQVQEQAMSSLEAKHKKELEDERNKIEGEAKERITKLTNQISELLDETKRLRAKDEDREIGSKTEI